MKQLLLAAGAIALTVGTAVAQDQVYDWSGAYMGVQAGYGWGKAKYISPEDGQSASPRPDGFLGGIYGGYNHQFANDFVLGIEGDVNISDSDGVSLFGPWPAFDSKFELKWSGAARIRLGYAVGRFLPFVAGGATAGGDRHHGLEAGGPLLWAAVHSRPMCRQSVSRDARPRSRRCRSSTSPSSPRRRASPRHRRRRARQ